MSPQPGKSSTSRKRKPNWTDPECLLLAQLIQKRQNIVRGKQSTGVSFQDKRRAWKEIVQAINYAFPLVQRTVSDCNKKWENLLAKAREEIKRQSNKDEEMIFEKLSAVTQIVISVQNLSEKKMKENKKKVRAESSENSNGEDGDSATEDVTSKQALIEVELSDPDSDPDPDQTITPEHRTTSTKIPSSPARQFSRPRRDVFAKSNLQSPCSSSSSSSSPLCRPDALREKFNLEMSVLRRKDKVLKLQEEYYALKIKLLKNQIK